MPAKKGNKTNAKTTTPKKGMSAAATHSDSENPSNKRASSEVQVPVRLIDQIVGQEKAVTIIKKAAAQKRNVLLVGTPGTGKSLMAQAMSELLPVSVLEDILVKPNVENENTPKIVAVKKGEGKKITQQERMQNVAGGGQINLFVMVFLFISFFFLLYFGRQQLGDVITAALLLMLGLTGVVMVLGAQLGRGRFAPEFMPSKLLVDNSKSATAPFMEATGARAGALLGDVRHDPFQTFFPSTQVTMVTETGLMTESMDDVVDVLMSYKEDVLTKEGKENYEAIHLRPGQLSVLGAVEGKSTLTPVLSVNRYDYDGTMIRLVSKSGKELIVTPGHHVAIRTGNGIQYKPASEVNVDDSIVLGMTQELLEPDAIVGTYSTADQSQHQRFHAYQEAKKQHPDWGYKRIAKSLGLLQHQTRWWHQGKHTPHAIGTLDWLTRKELLPLDESDPRIPRIARVLGSLYGDGGIFTNRNAIFLSSAERDVVEKFGDDLESFFGMEISKNARIIEGGEKGHSWCYQNTHRGIIRFFEALGAPVGNKTKIQLVIPAWIHKNPTWEDEFFGAFLAGEMGTPKIHTKGVYLTSLEVGITATKETEQNRILFLDQVTDYLSRRGIRTTSTYRGTTASGKTILRLQIEKKVESVLNLLTHVRLAYSPRKEKRIREAVHIWMAYKKKRFEALSKKGIGAEAVMKTLQLSPRSLYQVLNA
ncbi:ATP-binding protein [Candidatus Micrarchaeota archaeon]|nr:ATP-binding protein [Candidatus Micrarchaeota archaeon]